SDEYEPAVVEFTRQGEFVRRFTTPANLVPRDAAGTVDYANETATGWKGRTYNKGFEGLTISPDGKFAYAMLQAALVNDDADDGAYLRIVKFDVATGESVKQFAYKVAGTDNGQGISALVALNDHQFLVLERNNRGVGIDRAKTKDPVKLVYRIDVEDVADVSGIEIKSGVKPPLVAKAGQPLFDLARPLDEFGKKVPEKFEGLAIGPKLDDGS